MDTPNSTLAARLIRNLHEVPLEHWTRPPLYQSQSGQLSAGMAAQRLGVSIDIVPPGKQSCPYHFHHAQEELFIVLEGSGTLRVAGERLAIKAGDVIIIPPGPEYPHHILNTSDAPLKYLGIGTKEVPEICEYPDSGKVLAMNTVQGLSTLRSVHRKADAVDYWDGEA